MTEPEFVHVHRCPHCLTECGGAVRSEFSEDKTRWPQPGDVSVCLTCAAPFVFADETATRVPTEDELVLISEYIERIGPAFNAMLSKVRACYGVRQSKEE